MQMQLFSGYYVLCDESDIYISLPCIPVGLVRKCASLNKNVQRKRERLQRGNGNVCLRLHFYFAEF